MLLQASFKAAEEEQRQVIAKHGHELSMEALNDMKVGGMRACRSKALCLSGDAAFPKAHASAGCLKMHES